MNDLQQFSQRIEARLASARREPRWEPDEAKQYMAEFGPRRKAFEQLARQVIDVVVRPRMEKLASYFGNAAISEKEPAGRCECWFGYCDRFPATIRLEIMVEHDQRIENVFVKYELHIMPVFIKYDAHDRLAFSLDALDDEKVAQWVEKRLLAFVDTYLQMDRGEADFEEDIATDPVCGMRIRRSAAAAHTDHYGHPYFFCSEDCCQRFSQDPKRFVSFKIS